MHINQQQDEGPWYKQFWAWFVFTPLIIVMIASSVFVTIAFKGKQDVISDDYYKVGKMINQEFAPSHYAKELGLNADVDMNLATNLVTVTLPSSDWPVQETLLLHLSHPVAANKDHFITLKRVDALMWQADLKTTEASRWYLRLSALDDAGGEEWRLQGEIQLGESQTATLE